jgi:hypothetical protein
MLKKDIPTVILDYYLNKESFIMITCFICMNYSKIIA